MLGVVAALVLAAFVTLLVVAGGGDDSQKVSAGSSTTSSSSTTTSSTTSSTSSTTTTTAPSTTTVTTAPPTSTTPTTAAPAAPIVTGDGAVLRPPTVSDTRTMQLDDCRTLADAEWTATCGTATAKGAQLVWLVESKPTASGRTGRRALVLRKGTGSSYGVVLEVHDDNGVRFSDIKARVVDLSGDGKEEIAFGFHLTVGNALSLDVVEGPGEVVVHRELAAGVARVSSGQLDTWRRVDGRNHTHEVIQFRDRAWRIVASSTGPSSDIPPSQL